MLNSYVSFGSRGFPGRQCRSVRDLVRLRLRSGCRHLLGAEEVDAQQLVVVQRVGPQLDALVDAINGVLVIPAELLASRMSRGVPPTPLPRRPAGRAAISKPSKPTALPPPARSYRIHPVRDVHGIAGSSRGRSIPTSSSARGLLRVHTFPAPTRWPSSTGSGRGAPPSTSVRETWESLVADRIEALHVSRTEVDEVHRPEPVDEGQRVGAGNVCTRSSPCAELMSASTSARRSGRRRGRPNRVDSVAALGAMRRLRRL